MRYRKLIDATLTRSGTVGLRPGGTRDLEALRSLPYVRLSGKRGATWWTYLSDLRRDLGSKIRWGTSVPLNLRRLVEDVERREDGDDEAVLACFADGLTPYPFQLRGIHAILNSERMLVADDVGTGKTCATLGAMAAAFASGRANRAVLVVPAGLKYQWYEEVHKFLRDPPRTLVVSAGSRAARKRAYSSPWKVLIINPELLRLDVPLVERPFSRVDFVALDEASCIKSPDAKITRVMRYLFARTRFRLALTATPIENRLVELWSILGWIDHRVFMSKAYFDRRYVVWRKRFIKVWSSKWKKTVKVPKEEPRGYRNLREVRAKIRPRYIRRCVADVGLELPDLVVLWERLDLPKRQRALYQALRDKIVDRLGGLRGAALRAPLQALRQVCNSTALIEREEKKPSQVKVDRLRELLETELYGQQVIVFTDYERFARVLMAALREHKPAIYTGQMSKRERSSNVNAFLAGTRRVFIGTKALERGHNLQCASVIVNADLPFNPAVIKQRIGRARRIGSAAEVVRVINMIARDTIEERLILERIYAKRRLFEGVFDEDELSEADPMGSMKGGDVVQFL